MAIDVIPVKYQDICAEQMRVIPGMVHLALNILLRQLLKIASLQRRLAYEILKNIEIYQYLCPVAIDRQKTNNRSIYLRTLYSGNVLH